MKKKMMKKAAAVKNTIKKMKALDMKQDAALAKKMEKKMKKGKKKGAY